MNAEACPKCGGPMYGGVHDPEGRECLRRQLDLLRETLVTQERMLRRANEREEHWYKRAERLEQKRDEFKEMVENLKMELDIVSQDRDYWRFLATKHWGEQPQPEQNNEGYTSYGRKLGYRG